MYTTIYIEYFIYNIDTNCLIYLYMIYIVFGSIVVTMQKSWPGIVLIIAASVP